MHIRIAEKYPLVIAGYFPLVEKLDHSGFSWISLQKSTRFCARAGVNSWGTIRYLLPRSWKWRTLLNCKIPRSVYYLRQVLARFSSMVSSFVSKAKKYTNIVKHLNHSNDYKFALVSLFNGQSAFVDYLIPNTSFLRISFIPFNLLSGMIITLVLSKQLYLQVTVLNTDYLLVYSIWYKSFLQHNSLIPNAPTQTETLLRSRERAAACIYLHVNAHKTEYMCFNQTGDVFILNRSSLKLVDKFIYLGSLINGDRHQHATSKDIDSDKIKRSFLQAAVVLILLNGCTTWTLTRRMEKKLDSNYTRMLWAILNKLWRQHPTKQQLYSHLSLITKTIKVRPNRRAGHCWRSRDELIGNVLLWTPSHSLAKAGWPTRTYLPQLCADTGCNPEDMQEVMDDKMGWWETVRKIRASSGTCCWWWCIYRRYFKIDATPNMIMIYTWDKRNGVHLEHIP